MQRASVDPEFSKRCFADTLVMLMEPQEMSTPGPDNTPKAVPPNTGPKPAGVTWPTILMAIATTLISTLHFGTPTPKPDTVIVEPTNNTPPVNPVPVQPVQPTNNTPPVNPPNTVPVTPVQPVVPNTVPVVPVVPTPIVTPVIPTVAISDLKGNAIGNMVEAGVMFSVTANVGATLTGVPSSNADADIVPWSDNHLYVVLRNGCKLQIVVTGIGKPTIIQVQCNLAPQPPPTVVVPPVTPVGPVPVNPTPPANVTTKAGRIGVVEDAKNRPPYVASLFSNFRMWQKYRDVGIPVDFWHGGDDPATMPNAVDDIKAVKNAGVALPAIVVRDKTGQILYLQPLSKTADNVVSDLFPYTGVKAQ